MHKFCLAASKTIANLASGPDQTVRQPIEVGRQAGKQTNRRGQASRVDLLFRSQPARQPAGRAGKLQQAKAFFLAILGPTLTLTLAVSVLRADTNGLLPSEIPHANCTTIRALPARNAARYSCTCTCIASLDRNPSNWPCFGSLASGRGPTGTIGATRLLDCSIRSSIERNKKPDALIVI